MASQDEVVSLELPAPPSWKKMCYSCCLSVRKSRDVVKGLGKSYLLCLTTCPTLETTQLEVGSSDWKSTACHMVFGVPSTALKNPED